MTQQTNSQRTAERAEGIFCAIKECYIDDWIWIIEELDQDMNAAPYQVLRHDPMGYIVIDSGEYLRTEHKSLKVVKVTPGFLQDTVITSSERYTR